MDHVTELAVEAVSRRARARMRRAQMKAGDWGVRVYALSNETAARRAESALRAQADQIMLRRAFALSHPAL